MSSSTIELTSLDPVSVNLARNRPSIESFSDQTSYSDEDSISINNKDDEYPEGGLRAYSVVFGSFLGCVVNLGVINSIGAIQAYVSIHQLADFSTSQISWVFSIYLCLAYSIGIFIGSNFDKHGPKYLLIGSTGLWFAGFMAAASSTKIWHFILSFISLGIANGLGMTPCISVLSHWFSKGSGGIIGIATSGASIGGLTFPLVLRHSYVAYGYEMAIRIMGFICLGLMIACTMLVKGRFKRESKPLHSQSKWKNFINSFTKDSFKSFFDTTYLYILAGGFFAELLLILLLTYFSTYSISNGATESTAYILIAVWNAFGILGRWIPGFLSDHLGRFNVNVGMLLGFSLSILLVLLPFGHRIVIMYVFVSLGGFFSGTILCLLPACLSQTVKVRELGQKYGILNGFMSFANLFGVPLGSAIINQGTPHEYDMFVVFVGCLAILGTFFWYMARSTLVGFQFNIKV
jgi:MFS family permease